MDRGPHDDARARRASEGRSASGCWPRPEARCGPTAQGSVGPWSPGAEQWPLVWPADGLCPPPQLVHADDRKALGQSLGYKHPIEWIRSWAGSAPAATVCVAVISAPLPLRAAFEDSSGRLPGAVFRGSGPRRSTHQVPQVARSSPKATDDGQHQWGQVHRGQVFSAQPRRPAPRLQGPLHPTARLRQPSELTVQRRLPLWVPPT